MRPLRFALNAVALVLAAAAICGALTYALIERAVRRYQESHSDLPATIEAWLATEGASS